MSEHHTVRLNGESYKTLRELKREYGETDAFHVRQAIREYKESKDAHRKWVKAQTRSKDTRKPVVSK